MKRSYKVTLFLFTVTVLLFSGCKASLENDSASKLELRGSEVWRTIGQDEELLFSNVNNVSEVRMGPDGHTVHFKATEVNPVSSFLPVNTCADLTALVDPMPEDYIAAFGQKLQPQKAPWDFESIAYAYTIKGCGTYGDASGYLAQSNYFAYLKIDATKKATLVLQEIGSGVPINIPITEDLPDVFFGEQHDSFGPFAIHDEKNTMSYYYPIHDALVSKNIVVLSFGWTVFAANTLEGKFIGLKYLSQPDYNIIADSYWFDSRENLPYVVVAGGWEGFCGYEALIDVSDISFKITPLRPYNGGTFCDLFPFHTWDDDGLTFNFKQTIDISEKIPKEDMDLLISDDYSDDAVKKRYQKVIDLEEKFMATGEYIDVLCSEPGMWGAGCSGTIQGKMYRATPGEGLIEVLN